MSRRERGPEGPSRCRRVPLWLVGLSLASLFYAPGASAERPAFCGERYARDYEAPLRGMPRQHPPPQGELPFGPRNFSIHRIDRTPVVLEGSHFGYRFGGKNEGHRVLDLGWSVSATAWVVDADGHGRRRLGTRRWRARRAKDLDPLQLAFPAERPGFFRVDLRFSTLSGHTLAAYRDYFRVLRRRTDIGIRTGGEGFHPGEAVYGLLENLGAGKVIVPTSLDVERAEGSSWVEVPQPPSPESVMGGTWWLESGEAARCHRFDVPPGAPSGSYRFSASVYVVNEQRRETVTAPFQIAP